MDSTEVKILLASVRAKRVFMTQYLDNATTSASCAYYEGWLDALDSMETLIKELMISGERPFTLYTGEY